MDRAYSSKADVLIADRFSSIPFGNLARTFGLAALATLLLLSLMAALVSQQYEEPKAPPTIKVENIHMPKMVPDPVRYTQPTPPAGPQPIPDVPKVTPTTVDSPTRIGIAPPVVDSGKGKGGIVIDRDPVPVFRPAARYPASALRRGVEGYVVVEFTITETGAVTSPRIIGGYDNAGNPTTVFNQSALNAVKRYKFQPKLVEGVAQARHGVRNRIRYRIAQ